MKRTLPEIEAAFAQLDREHLRRQRRTVERFAEAGSRVLATVDGRKLIDFSGNDYLGLARHPAISAALINCAQRVGVGSGASHLVTGHGSEHAGLEEELAAFTGRERALLFSTGYMANLAVLTTLANRGEMVLLDRLSHASLIDGGLLSGARFKRYAHADAAAAEAALQRSADTASVVATDGVFSMDGDIGPLDQLARASRAHDAWLVVDDAHGLGVVGATGRGAVEHFGLDREAVPVLVGTLGKAFGTFGAFVAGSDDLIELLIQKARPYIYTTALPQAIAAATRKALEIAERESWRRERVLSLTARFRAAAEQVGIPLLRNAPKASMRARVPLIAPPGPSAAPSPCASRAPPVVITPIQPVLVGRADIALRMQQELLEGGFCVIAIRPPTVPHGTARLRVTLSAAHTEAQVDSLIDALNRTCRKFGDQLCASNDGAPDEMFNEQSPH